MQFDYSVYETIYSAIRSQGSHGWGGDTRLAKGPAHITGILGSGWVPKNGQALEIGCGEGNLSRLLEMHGYRVSGVDVSGTAIAWAQEKAPESSRIEYICGNFLQPDILAGRTFDLILDGACLHCIGGKDREVFLKNVNRLLASGGTFDVCSLCSKDDLTRETVRSGLGLRHISAANDLLAELAHAGLEILQAERRIREVDDNLLVFARKPRPL